MIILDDVSIASPTSLPTEERKAKRSKYKNLHEEVMDLRLEVGRHQARYQRVRGELELFKQQKEQEIEKLKARIRYLEQHHFGDKKDNSKNNDKLKSDTKPTEPNPKRGARTGEKRKGKSRRDYSKLEKRTETHDVEESERYCPGCGKEHPEINNEDITEVIEIEVKPYIRRIVKKKRRKSCKCGHVFVNGSDDIPIKETSPDEREPSRADEIARPDENEPAKKSEIIMPKVSGALIPGGNYGASLWSKLLLDKYAYGIPMNRVLQQLNGHGLPLSLGTVTDGLKKILPLFEPLYQAILEKNRSEFYFNADETRWNVFEETEGKTSHKWWLWVFLGRETAVYVIDPTRSAEVPKKHFPEGTKAVIAADRYGAYKSLSAKRASIRIAYCWVHVRRDFIKGANGYPSRETWYRDWVTRIDELFKCRHEWADAQGQKEESKRKLIMFNELDELQAQFKQQLDEDLKQDNKLLHDDQRKVLNSLKNHWDGLSEFKNDANIPFENNAAERALRPAVVGRKGYYGSGSVWSANLTQILFSIFVTLQMANFNLCIWLNKYLQVCTQNQGKAPQNYADFLPWNMSEDTLISYRQKEVSYKNPNQMDSS